MAEFWNNHHSPLAALSLKNCLMHHNFFNFIINRSFLAELAAIYTNYTSYNYLCNVWSAQKTYTYICITRYWLKKYLNNIRILGDVPISTSTESSKIVICNRWKLTTDTTMDTSPSQVYHLKHFHTINQRTTGNVLAILFNRTELNN